MAAAHERLVHLVRRRVERPEHDRERLAREGAQQERAEDRVLRQVRELAHYEMNEGDLLFAYLRKEPEQERAYDARGV